MNNSLIYDFRYPFSSGIDFFTGLYFLNLEALHLTIGYLLLVYLIIKVFIDKNLELTLKFSVIYFAATIFNNPAYSFGVTIAEIFGIMAAVIHIKSLKISNNKITMFMILFFVVSLIHLLLIAVFSNLILESISIMRIAVIAKIIVLSLNISILFHYIKSMVKIEIFIKYMIYFVNVVAISYLIQILVFVSGILPYGSFSPAGWSESIIPSFGATSIERGHLGKFFVPLFPLYLYAFNTFGYRKSFILFLLISFLNFSASAYAFLFSYLILTMILFGVELKKIIFLFSISVVLFYFSEQITTLIMKIYQLAIEQDNSGGRSFSLIFDVWNNFPFGYGYGGSTFRNLHGIEGLDLNNAIVVFFGQLSILAPFMIIALLYTFCSLYKNYAMQTTDKFLKKLLLMSMIVMLVIFAADSLWFTTTIWIPLIVFIIIIHVQKRNLVENNLR